MQNNIKKLLKWLGVILLVLAIVAVIYLPTITHGFGLDTPRQAAQINILITPSATPEPESTQEATTDTPQVEETVQPEQAASQTITVDVNVTKGLGEEEETPAESSSDASPGWETSLENREAALKLVIANQGEVDISPCFVITAIYDEQGLPVKMSQAQISSEMIATPVTADVNKENDICVSGISGQPAFFYKADGEIIKPASSQAYTIIMQFDKKQELPYKGTLDIYIPGALPALADETKSKLEPNQSVTFTIQGKATLDYAVAWQGLRDKWQPPLTAGLEAIAVLLALALVVTFAVRLRSYTQVSLSLDAITDKDNDGEKIKALLQDELDRFRGPAPYQNFSPTLATAASQTVVFELPTAMKSFGAVQVVLDILGYIFKPNTLKVSGQTQKSKAKGIGLTLTLTDTRRGSIIDTQTFWELDYSGTGKLVEESGNSSFDPYLLIVQPAATWITYKTSEHLNRKYLPLGTESWQSHAYSICAMHMFALVNRKNAPAYAKHRALDLFQTALDYDRNNPVANINLSRFEYESASSLITSQAKELQYKLSQARLSNALAITERIKQDEKNQKFVEKFLNGIKNRLSRRKEVILDHELWGYQALYNQALVASVEALEFENRDPKNTTGAKKRREFVINKISRLIDMLIEKSKNIPQKTSDSPKSEMINLDAVLDILGEQADVDTPEELLKAGRTRANRRSLAIKSDGKLTYEVVTKWVKIADLMRLDGVEELYATLLYTAGIDSPQELKERNATNLRKKLETVNKAKDIVKRLPSASMLEKWIKEAKNLAQNTSLSTSNDTRTSSDSSVNNTTTTQTDMKNWINAQIEHTNNTIANLEDSLRDKRSAAHIRAFRQACVCLLGMLNLDVGGPPDPNFDEKVSGDEDKFAQINYRVHYNLACYFSLATLDKKISSKEDVKETYLEKGLFHLSQALEIPGDLSNFAQKDSDLNPLKNNPANKVRFIEIVNRHAETPIKVVADPGNLDAVLDILGEQADVDTPEELLKAGRTRANRRSLAIKSDGKLTYEVVTKWVKIADLMRLDGVEELYATLLYTAGIDSPQELKERNAANLRKKLETVNKANNIVEHLPSERMLNEWIEEAKNMPDQV